MVDRYRIQPEGFAAHMRPAKPVDMVFAEEHDAEITALKAENERQAELIANLMRERDILEARAEAAERALAEERKALDQIAAIEPQSNCDAGSMARSRMRDIARLYIARRALAERAGGVKVGALAWKERVGVDGTFDAYTSIGHYIATITDDDRGMWFVVGLTQSNYCAPDIDIVKAAAQADYERRILSALTTEPAAPAISCYECGHELNGPYCPKCRPAAPSACPTCAGTGFRDKGGARVTIQRVPCPDCGPAAPEGQQDNEPRAYIVHAPEDDYYGTGPDRLQFHPLAQHDLDNGYRQTPLYGRPAEQAVAWQHMPGCGEDRESKMVSVSEGAFCDPCIAPLVAALNTAGIETVASCCGHGHRPGVIALRDGRELFITKDFDEARQVDAIFPIDINGNTRPSEQAVTDEIVAKVSHGFLKKWGFPIAEHFIRDILKAAMEAGHD